MSNKQNKEFTDDEHINSIDYAINELVKLVPRTMKTNTNNSQSLYIGTALNATIGMFGMAANSLDKKSSNTRRRISFESNKDWIAMTILIHRACFSFIHTSIEKGIHETLSEKKIIVQSSTGKNYLNVLNKIELKDNPLLQKELDKVKKRINKLPPSFDDYYNSLLNMTTLPIAIKANWINFLKGLGVIRNKASHSNTILSENEKKVVESLKLEKSILQIKNNELIIYMPIHAKLIEMSLNFWDDILDKIAE